VPIHAKGRTYGRTDVLTDRDKQTDITQVIGTLQDYENASKV